MVRTAVRSASISIAPLSVRVSASRGTGAAGLSAASRAAPGRWDSAPLLSKSNQITASRPLIPAVRRPETEKLSPEDMAPPMKPRRVQRQHIVRAESPYCGILRSLPAIPLNVDAPIAELQKLGTTIGYGYFQVAEEAAVEVSSTSRRAGGGGIGARTLRSPSTTPWVTLPRS